MKKPLLQIVIPITLLFFLNRSFGQTPDLRSVNSYVLFTANGNIKNSGTSNLTGDVGTNNGLFTGFGNVNGVMHKMNSQSRLAATDLEKAYNQLNAATPAFFREPVLGNGDILNPGVYSITKNASLQNTLTLDAKGNANAVFIFKIEGTLSSTAAATVNLINGALPCNVFWKIEGEVNLASGTAMKGTLIAHHSAITMGANVSLEGRALSTLGDVTVNRITANTPTGCGSLLLRGPIAPSLASTTNFTLFSGDGTVINKGITTVNGDVGTNLSFTEGYDSLKVSGIIHLIPDGATATSATDLLSVYNYLHSLSPDIELLYPDLFGNKLVLTPHTYHLNTATSLVDTLYLNAGGNTDAVFVININGALSASTNAKVILTNGAQASNVFWVVDGPVNLNNDSDFKGTIVCNGAIDLNSGALLTGKALTTSGALNTTSAFVTNQVSNATSPYTWAGGNGDWNVASNWITKSKKRVPSGYDADVIINSGSPSISTAVNVRNVHIASSACLSILSSISICGNFTGGVDTAAVIRGAGRVILTGTAPQLLSGKVTFTNLELDNATGASVSAGSTVSITGIYTPSSGTLVTNGGLVLKSSADGTALIAKGSGDYISGPVTIERYIPSKRSYRFLTAPVNSATSIKGNWMENANNENTSVNNNPAPGYGTHITGNGGDANGFDATATNNPSLFTFNNQTQVWVPVKNTAGTLNAGNPYRIMIRGSRSTNLNNNEAHPSVTTLRAKGSVVTGTVVLAKPGAGGTPGMPELSASINGYSFIANPYPAVVDWKKLKKKDISKSIYYYDPTLTGSNGRGAYVTYNDLLDAVNLHGSKVDNNIQSGQAFFVQTTGTNPSLTFTEDSKSAIQKSIFRQAGTMPYVSVKLQLPTQVNTEEAADGFAAYFSNDFDSSIADDDSYKFTNLDENIGILRNGKTLSIEGRKLVTAPDTLPVRMWQLTQNEYLLKINVSDFENVTGYLEDGYLNTLAALNNNTETTIPFSLNADPASAASNRFRIVFRPLTTLPIRITGIKAYEKDKGVQVQWNVQNETGVQRYVVEKSGDMRSFEEISSLKAANKGDEIYSVTDDNPFNGDNFYRIKSIENNGSISYTEVVKVRLVKGTAFFSVYPNPVKDKKASLQLSNIPAGAYSVMMFDQSGHQLVNDKIIHYRNTSAHMIELPPATPSGSYYFVLKSAESDGVAFKQNVLVL